MKGNEVNAKNSNVSPENEDLCRQAAEECPVEAIIISD